MWSHRIKIQFLLPMFQPSNNIPESTCCSGIVSVGQYFQYGKKHEIELQLYSLAQSENILETVVYPRNGNIRA